ncbi:sulfonate ABC transporter substrate-binding protein [Caballeronia grimmiae]|uniref:Sulfonate ABC transporter substrate-binding protein n=1 Tax=Caballeronia grimmiae TaxID=1071679 RepID=A0A069NFA7_9BURK|nr:sulfonate ABC transporter substrate-binding protein [Caballeronia grimmiae]
MPGPCPILLRRRGTGYGRAHHSDHRRFVGVAVLLLNLDARLRDALSGGAAIALRSARAANGREFRASEGNTGVPIDVGNRTISRLEWGVRYPVTDEVIRAQQDAANIVFEKKVIPRRIDVRQAVLQIK